MGEVWRAKDTNLGREIMNQAALQKKLESLTEQALKNTAFDDSDS